MPKNRDAEKIVREIKRKTRRKFSAEEKIRIVLEGLGGEENIAELCRREGMSPNLYYKRRPTILPKRLVIIVVSLPIWFAYPSNARGMQRAGLSRS